MTRRGGRGTARRYPRTARLNELLREILAEELDRIDDDRLQLLTVTAVDVEGDLRHARVYYDSLQGESGDEEVLAALDEIRWRLQSAIGRQARMKRTPELTFAPDLALRTGARIESLLAQAPPPGDGRPPEVDVDAEPSARPDGPVDPAER